MAGAPAASADRSAAPALPDKVGYNRDVRPILSENCFYCHGPDKNRRKAKLRLDERDAALAGGKSGDPAIVPGHPEQSALVERVMTTDDDDLMPPSDSHKKLSAAIQVECFTAALYVPLGQYFQSAAWRSNITGQLKGQPPLFWNVQKG